MASAIFNRNHVASTQDEKAIERGFSSSVGLLGGIAFSLTAALVLGANQAMVGATVLLFLSAVPLGIMGANRLLTSEAPELPVLEMMRYSAVTLPIVLMTELLLGGHALGLMGDFVGSLQMFGPRFVLALVASGFAHALACRVVWDDEDASRDQRRPNVDWESRYVEARTRLARTTVDLKRRREAEEDALAAFDRKLGTMMDRGEDEWVLDSDVNVSAPVAQTEPAAELA